MPVRAVRRSLDEVAQREQEQEQEQEHRHDHHGGGRHQQVRLGGVTAGVTSGSPASVPWSAVWFTRAGLILGLWRLVRNGQHHGCRYPSGLPFVRASSCCRASSVKYVKRRSFGVTGSTPACSAAMLLTRTMTAWAVIPRCRMRSPVPRGARSAPGQSPRCAIQGVDRYLATVCRVDLPLVVANGDDPGHLVVVRELERDCFRALQAGA